MSYKNRHSIYFKILAAVLACLLAHNNIAYSLSPTSRFKPITTVQGEDGRDLIAHPAVVPHPLDDYAFPNVVAQDEHTRQIVIEEIKHILTVLKIQLPQEKLDEVTRFNVTGKVRREYIAEYEAKEKEAKREADRTRRLICILNTTTCYLIAMILILIVQDYEFARAISTPILLTAFAAIPIVPAILIQRYIESRLSGPLEVSIMREKGDFFVSGSVDDDGQATIEIDTYSDTKNENARGINGLRKVITHEFVHTLRLACVIREEEYAATAEEIRAAELGDAHSFYRSSGILEEGRGFYRKSKNVEDALKAARYEAAMRTALTGIGWMAAEIGAKSPSEEAFH
jgi:hypothetical protein